MIMLETQIQSASKAYQTMCKYFHITLIWAISGQSKPSFQKATNTYPGNLDAAWQLGSRLEAQILPWS